MIQYKENKSSKSIHKVTSAVANHSCGLILLENMFWVHTQGVSISLSLCSYKTYKRVVPRSHACHIMNIYIYLFFTIACFLYIYIYIRYIYIYIYIYHLHWFSFYMYSHSNKSTVDGNTPWQPPWKQPRQVFSFTIQWLQSSCNS